MERSLSPIPTELVADDLLTVACNWLASHQRITAALLIVTILALGLIFGDGPR